MAEEVAYMQFFSYIVRYQSKADASEHNIFYGARDLKDIAFSNLLPNNGRKDRLTADNLCSLYKTMLHRMQVAIEATKHLLLPMIRFIGLRRHIHLKANKLLTIERPSLI